MANSICDRPPAVITPSDVELIRKVIYAPGAHRAGEAQEEDDAIFHDAMSREAIGQEGAHWLFGMIGNASSLSKGAVHLLRLIKNNSSSIDPALVPLFDKAGL